MSGLQDFKAGTLYRHYKGGLYEIVGIGQHSETLEQVIVYRDAHDPFGGLWVRPQEMWGGTVEWPDGTQRPRFMRTSLK